MALFDKKTCDICGGKIGLLGNRKLDDGNMCKDCAALLSPFMTDRRRTSIADIKEHLAYREANLEKVTVFNVTRSLGTGTKILLDENTSKFIITSAKRWQDGNPDVMDFSQVTGCNVNIDEVRSEIKQKDKDGKDVSYNPQRFVHEYNFNMVINVNSPWFSEIKFRLNNPAIKVEPPAGGRGLSMNRGAEVGRTSVAYRQCEQLAEEIKAVFTEVRQTMRENITAANAPQIARTCPHCGATTIPDASGRCEFCGGAMTAMN